MGKFYTVHGQNLYVYVTEDDELIPIKDLPSLLGLFEADVTWRYNNRIAVCSGIPEDKMEQAKTILEIFGYEELNVKESVLERYFAEGDESVLSVERAEEIPPPEVSMEQIWRERASLLASLERLKRRFSEGAVTEELYNEQKEIIERRLKELERLEAAKLSEYIEERGIEVEVPAKAEVVLRVEGGEGKPEEGPKEAGVEAVAEVVEKPEAVEEVEEFERPKDEADLIDHVVSYVRSRGFTYPEGLVKTCYVSLKTKQFMVFAGPSGMGKTAMTKLLAEALTGSDRRYLRIAVQPDWVDEKPILGFYNPITQTYVSTPFLDLLLDAIEHRDRLYIVCLDEMNLARVERYFASILSAMESEDREIVLHGISGGVKTVDGRVIPPRIKLPENVVFIGTINVDEVSHPLSPKLLDRANVIEFHAKKVGERGEPTEYERRVELTYENLEAYRNGVDEGVKEYVLPILERINSITSEHGFPVSLRVREEVLRYVANSRGVFSDNLEENMRMAMDLQIKQRILPKLSGSEEIRPMLEDLLELFEGVFPESAEKVRRMLRRLNRVGFTSFYD